MAETPTNYATDGLCHNAEPGTFNHECGKPAAWIGTNHKGFKSGFCEKCRYEGFEALSVMSWEKATTPSEFDVWMKLVDAACLKLTGVSIHDLIDMPFVDWSEDGFSPKAAAVLAIRIENGEEDF